jgi:uncharacterized protein (TIGR01777 family)
MNTALFTVMTVQALLGAFDNLWHHEWAAHLPHRISARRELALHAAREAIYGLLFLGLAWWRFEGLWAVGVAMLLATEVVITITDFLEEDRTRRLPPFERALHTVLALVYGVLLGGLAPVLWAGAQQPTSLQWAPHGLWSLFFSLAGGVVLLWSVRNALAVRGLRRAAQAVAAERPAPLPTGPAVLVTGATGFIGSALVQRLGASRRRVIVYTRDVPQARAQFGSGVWCVDRLCDIPAEAEIGAIVHLAGAPVLGRPWTRRRRQQLLDSRVAITGDLLVLMQRLLRRPSVFVAASAVGFYGVPVADTPSTEVSPAEPGRFQSDLCAAIEREAQRTRAQGVRVAFLRFGLVLGSGGGAYAPLALAARFGLGAILGSGRQPVPWIHRDDAVGLIVHALRDERLQGPVNAVAPEQIEQRHFARALAASFGRRVWLRAPGFLLRGLLGEMSEILLCGQRAVPQRAIETGYAFCHATLHSALTALAGRPAEAAPAAPLPY